MKNPFITVFAWFLLLLAPAAASAQCPFWKVGPLLPAVFSNGANGVGDCATVFDPDGAGPLQPQLIAGGAFSTMQGVAAYQVAALSPETGKWSPLGSGVTGQVMAMTVYNGELIVAGTLATAGGVSVNKIAAWNGTSWHALGSGITGTYIRSLAVYNGQLIAGGTFLTAGGVSVNNIASWDGSSWHALGSGVGGLYVIGMAAWGTDLIAGGAFSSAGGVTVNNVARWDGSAWHAMGAGIIGSVVAFQPYNGLLYAATNLTSSGGSVAWWNGTSWGASPAFANVALDAITARSGALYVAGEASLGASNAVWEFTGGTLVQLGYGGISGTIFGLTMYNNELIALGSFTQADGRTANHIAHWDNTNWGSYGGGTITNVYAMTEFGGRTVAGGDFHMSLPTSSEAHNIMGVSNGTLASYGTGMDGEIDALKGFKYSGIHGASELIAGGGFVHAGGVVANSIARWDIPFLVVSPVNWTAMGPGFNGPVYAIERFNNLTYAAGGFTTSGGTTVNYIARWNESTQLWENIGGTNGTVYALKAYGSYLYVGGAFSNAGGVSTGGLARWNGSTWSNVGGFFGGSVYALEVHSNLLAIGGSYPGIGGSPNLAWYDGLSYGTYGTGGTNAAVHALHSTGTNLYVGGDFTSLGGLAINRFGYWNGSWHDCAGGTDNSVFAITHYHNLVQLGGPFVNADGGSFANPPGRWLQWDETGVPQFFSSPFQASTSGGNNVSFTAVPDTGYIGLTLQWVHGTTALADGPTGTGSTLSGVHTEVLNITNVGTADLGDYRLVASNGCGSDTSGAGTLVANTAVGGPGDPGAAIFEAMGPNPSQGATQVAFALERESAVRVSVRDVAGRTLRFVDLGRLPPGRHTAAWDAKDTAGGHVRAGVYFVSLEIDGRAHGTKRLVIVR